MVGYVLRPSPDKSYFGSAIAAFGYSGAARWVVWAASAPKGAGAGRRCRWSVSQWWRIAAEDEQKRLAAEAESRRIATEEEQLRIAAEEEAMRARTGGAKKSKVSDISRQPSVKSSTSTQVDFDAEANKTARILGCQPAQVKVTGAEGGNIQYKVACADSKMLNLSCDPSGLCLQKKSVASSKQ
jgi:hypothetical protein